MSKTKAGGSTRNGRDSESKRLGTKVFDGEKISAGSIMAVSYTHLTLPTTLVV